MAKHIPKLHLTQINRFLHNVDYSGSPDSCWLWTGHVQQRTGYGTISINGRELRVHRVAYFLEHGRIDESLMVLHKCDVRLCVNPAHLYQGTAKDNSTDTSRRGRVPRMYGETNGKAKLTRQTVKAIKRMLADKASGRCHLRQYKIARQFGVSEATVSYLKNGGRWDSLADD
ncbi:MAG TPA: HNH endonuclease [Pyrinomonadaceae bacterium]|nr:HNH endonuclease [Pyrinomonadaceae bacterium]